ncbi:MAG: hypothetical protein ACQEW9_16290 [Bacteroidota bacterium]
MIFEFEPIVSWTFLTVLFFLLLVVGLLPIYFYWRKGLPTQRLLTKGLLFLAFVFFFFLTLLQPSWEMDENQDPVLVYQDGLSLQLVSEWKDSLQVAKVVPISDFKRQSDRVILLGDYFKREDLYALREVDFDWVFPESNGLIKEIAWKSYLRKGVRQKVELAVYTDQEDHFLHLAEVDTDSVLLKKGWNWAELGFEPRGLGRIELPLLLGKDTLTHLRFFVGETKPKRYHFQMGFPSMESRTLSTWLRQKGEAVSEQVQLSRDTFLESGEVRDTLQIQIIDPRQINTKAIQEWVKNAEGALILMQVSEPVSLANEVNRLFGTAFELERSGSEVNRQVDLGINALPYSWKDKSGQTRLYDQSVAIQNSGGVQIAISLIASTAELILEGKEATYESFWGGLFGQLEPDEDFSLYQSAPVFRGLPTHFELMQRDSFPESWEIGVDTIFLQKNAINPFQRGGNWQPTGQEWMNSGDDFSIYAFSPEELPTVYTSAMVRAQQLDNQSSGEFSTPKTHKLSDWIGLIGMLVALGLIWLEPKWNA